LPIPENEEKGTFFLVFFGFDEVGIEETFLGGFEEIGK
jgi:hypothetical protein